MSDLLGLEFWSKKDLVAEVERLRALEDGRAFIERCFEERESALAQSYGQRDDLQAEVERLKAELASAQTIKRC